MVELTLGLILYLRILSFYHLLSLCDDNTLVITAYSAALQVVSIVISCSCFNAS